MNCNDIEHYLFFLAEGTPVERQAEVQQHLESCAECRDLLHRMKQDLNAIEIEKKLKPQADITALIMAEIETQEKPITAWQGWNKVVLMAAMLTGIYLGLNLGSFHKTETLLATNEISDELTYFDDFQQESIEYNLISEEE